MSDVLTYQSRWGYHPCSALTAKKLRRLNFLGMAARRVFGEWKRWSRKASWNRFLRDDGGTKDLCHDLRTYNTPWLQPKQAPVMLVHLDNLLVYSREARMPKATPEEVAPFRYAEGQIDSMLADMEKWYAERPSRRVLLPEDHGRVAEDALAAKVN